MFYSKLHSRLLGPDPRAAVTAARDDDVATARLAQAHQQLVNLGCHSGTPVWTLLNRRWPALMGLVHNGFGGL
jgi:hypothetical protein